MYELGQFLQILLWIFLPVFVAAVLITTYVHYRKKRKRQALEDPIMGLYKEGDLLAMPAGLHGNTDASPEEGPTAYKGLLWLKDKYEQDREQSTNKYLKLKEEYRQLVVKYEDLKEQTRTSPTHEANPPTRDDASPTPEAIVPSTVPPTGEAAPPTREELIELDSLRDQLAEKNLQLAFLQNQLDQRISNFHQLEHQHREHIGRIADLETRNADVQEALQEREARIARLQEQLKEEMERSDEIKEKLESGGKLLLRLHGELDELLSRTAAGTEDVTLSPGSPVPGSIAPESIAPGSLASELPAPESSPTPRIAAWVESDELAAI